MGNVWPIAAYQRIQRSSLQNLVYESVAT